MTESPTPGHAPDLPALSAYLDDELGAGERQRVAAHLAACPACAARLGELQGLSAGLRALPGQGLGFDLAGVIEGRLAAPRQPSVAPRRRAWFAPWRFAIGAAASIAAGVFMGTALVAGGGAPSAVPPVAAMRVFDAMPPGSLCIGLESCYLKESIQ